jgi:DNA-binding transcriptional MerR regulator
LTKKYTIGHLSSKTGCKIPTIRYYEKIGLLSEPNRSLSNTRLYSDIHLERLAFVQHCRELGFKQDEIRGLLELTGQTELSCKAVTDIAHTHLDDINNKISRLTTLKAELEHMIAACKGGTIGQCRIVEILADHSHEQCLTKDHQDSLL